MPRCASSSSGWAAPLWSSTPARTLTLTLTLALALTLTLTLALARTLTLALTLAELPPQEWHTRLPLASAQGEEEEEEEEQYAPGGREGGALPDSALRRRQRQSWGDGPDA